MKNLLLAVSFLLSGCSFMPVHSVNVNPKLNREPVTAVFIATPQINPKPKRARPNWDFQEMFPEKHAAIQSAVSEALAQALKSKVNVILPPEPMADEWLKKLGTQLAKGTIPLNANPLPLNHEAVLIVGVQYYGTSDGQLKFETLFTGRKEFRFGKSHWYHEVTLNILLVQPKTGEILMAVEHKEEIKVVGSGTDPRAGKDPAALAEALRKTVQVLVDALPKQM